MSESDVETALHYAERAARLLPNAINNLRVTLINSAENGSRKRNINAVDLENKSSMECRVYIELDNAEALLMNSSKASSDSTSLYDQQSSSLPSSAEVALKNPHLTSRSLQELEIHTSNVLPDSRGFEYSAINLPTRDSNTISILKSPTSGSEISHNVNCDQPRISINSNANTCQTNDQIQEVKYAHDGSIVREMFFQTSTAATKNPHSSVRFIDLESTPSVGNTPYNFVHQTPYNLQSSVYTPYAASSSRSNISIFSEGQQYPQDSEFGQNMSKDALNSFIGRDKWPLELVRRTSVLHIPSRSRILTSSKVGKIVYFVSEIFNIHDNFALKTAIHLSDELNIPVMAAMMLPSWCYTDLTDLSLKEKSSKPNSAALLSFQRKSWHKATSIHHMITQLENLNIPTALLQYDTSLPSSSKCNTANSTWASAMALLQSWIPGGMFCLITDSIIMGEKCLSSEIDAVAISASSDFLDENPSTSVSLSPHKVKSLVELETIFESRKQRLLSDLRLQVSQARPDIDIHPIRKDLQLKICSFEDKKKLPGQLSIQNDTVIKGIKLKESRLSKDGSNTRNNIVGHSEVYIPHFFSLIESAGPLFVNDQSFDSYSAVMSALQTGTKSALSAIKSAQINHSTILALEEEIAWFSLYASIVLVRKSRFEQLSKDWYSILLPLESQLLISSLVLSVDRCMTPVQLRSGSSGDCAFDHLQSALIHKGYYLRQCEMRYWLAYLMSSLPSPKIALDMAVKEYTTHCIACPDDIGKHLALLMTAAVDVASAFACVSKASEASIELSGVKVMNVDKDSIHCTLGHFRKSITYE